VNCVRQYLYLSKMLCSLLRLDCRCFRHVISLLYSSNSCQLE
jgi:hypothetical protein